MLGRLNLKQFQSFPTHVLKNTNYRWIRSFSNLPLTVFSEEEEILRDAVKKFSLDIVKPKVQEMDQTGQMDRSIIQGLFDQGLLSIEVEEKYGGIGASFTNVCISIEELSKIDPSVGLICDLQNTVVNNVFRFHANEELKQKYLPHLTSNKIGSFCLSEGGSGSDAFALQTTATPSSDGKTYTLNGQKMWISNVEYADVFIVFANVDPSKGYKGITCFVLDRDIDGLEFGKPENKLGVRASSTCSITLNNVQVSKNQIMGNIGEGYKIAIGTLNEGRIGIASQMIGLAQGVFEETMPYLFERKQFGSSIGKFQGMEHQYATIAMNIEAGRLLVYNAARLKDSGHSFVKEASMAKLFASQVAEQTASKCIEWMGGIGYMKDLLIEKYFRDSKVGSIYEGTSNMQLQTIAKYIQQKYQA